MSTTMAKWGPFHNKMEATWNPRRSGNARDCSTLPGKNNKERYLVLRILLLIVGNRYQAEHIIRSERLTLWIQHNYCCHSLVGVNRRVCSPLNSILTRGAIPWVNSLPDDENSLAECAFLRWFHVFSMGVKGEWEHVFYQVKELNCAMAVLVVGCVSHVRPLSLCLTVRTLFSIFMIPIWTKINSDQEKWRRECRAVALGAHKNAVQFKKWTRFVWAIVEQYYIVTCHILAGSDIALWTNSSLAGEWTHLAMSFHRPSVFFGVCHHWARVVEWPIAERIHHGHPGIVIWLESN